MSKNNFTDEYLLNLNIGRDSENRFLENLHNVGKIAEIYYLKHNGKKYQLIETFKNIFVRCPDIQITENNGEVILRIEVKSFTKLYSNEGEHFVTIPVVQFDDYLQLLKFEEIEIKVVFHVKRTDDWYWENLIVLDMSKSAPKRAYFPKDDRFHYLWNHKDLRTNFDWISE
jgi:hypothetical protein